MDGYAIALIADRANGLRGGISNFQRHAIVAVVNNGAGGRFIADQSGVINGKIASIVRNIGDGNRAGCGSSETNLRRDLTRALALRRCKNRLGFPLRIGGNDGIAKIAVGRPQFHFYSTDSCTVGVGDRHHHSRFATGLNIGVCQFQVPHLNCEHSVQLPSIPHPPQY